MDVVNLSCTTAAAAAATAVSWSQDVERWGGGG